MEGKRKAHDNDVRIFNQLMEISCILHSSVSSSSCSENHRAFTQQQVRTRTKRKYEMEKKKVKRRYLRVKTKTGRQPCHLQKQTAKQSGTLSVFLNLRIVAESWHVIEAEAQIWVIPHLVLLMPPQFLQDNSEYSTAVFNSVLGILLGCE